MAKFKVDEKDPNAKFIPKSYGCRLGHKDKMTICAYIAEMHSLLETKQYIEEAFKASVTINWIKKTFSKGAWPERIAEFKDKYLADVDGIAGAHKKVRLARYDILFDKAMAAGKFQQAKAILDSIREEIEGKGSKIVIGGNVLFAQINKLDDVDLVKERNRIQVKLDRLSPVPMPLGDDIEGAGHAE